MDTIHLSYTNEICLDDETEVNSQLYRHTNIVVTINNLPIFPPLPSICVIFHIFQKVFVYFLTEYMQSVSKTLE